MIATPQFERVLRRYFWFVLFMVDKMRCIRVFAFALVLACLGASEVSARRIKQNTDNAVIPASDDSAAVPVVPAAVVAVPDDAVASRHVWLQQKRWMSLK